MDSILRRNDNGSHKYQRLVYFGQEMNTLISVKTCENKVLYNYLWITGIQLSMNLNKCVKWIQN